MEKKLIVLLACLFLCIGKALAQSKISGTVVFQDDGSPVLGATVKAGSGNAVAVTDADGKFTIAVPNGSRLAISYVGMETQTVAARNGMVVKLQSNTTLNEVVVTGMQHIDRRLFTGASTSINAGEAKLDGVADISRSLEGRAAGVSVQNVTGTFGTAPKIRVRGATSIYGDSKPLWVVDGVIMEDVTEVGADELSSGDAVTLISSAIAGLNADDIESFQILKDGSATSIYGARAMAGVIVVTTKKGRAGHSKISYTGEYTMRLIPSYSNFNIMNSQEQMGVYREMRDKGWLNFAETYRASESGVYGKMYQLMNTYDPVSGTFAMENTTDAENAYLQLAEFRNTNWFDQLFSNGIQHNHSVSMSGGTDKLNFYTSLSVMVDPGWYKASDVKRYTGNLNATYNISDKLSFNIITSASYRRQKAPGTLSQSVDPVYGEVKRDFDINPYSYSLNTSRTLDANTYYTRNYAPFNILAELENNYIDLDVVDLKFQGELKYKPIRGLEFLLLGAAKYATTGQAHHIMDDSNQAMAYRAMADATIRNANPYLYTDPDDPYALPVSILPNGGIYQKTSYKMNSYDVRGTVNWNHTFAQDHIVNLFGGFEVSDISRNKDFFNGWGMQYSRGELPFYVYQFFKKSIETNSDYYSLSNTFTRTSAFFANATYSYKGRYTLNGTYRYEGTNRLGKARSARWLPTWNVSGAWNAHEEPWFDATFKNILSHLTLKASYSLTGDPGPSNVTNSSVVLRSYKPYRPFTNIQESGLDFTDLANKDLTYEKKHEFNIGADMGFVNNRINLTVDWYKRNNYDLIGPIKTAGAGGQIQKLANVATMESHGVEFSLNTKNIQTRNFSWTSDFIFSYAKNKVTELESTAQIVDVVSGTGFALEGYPVRGLFSYRFEGLSDKGMPLILEEDGQQTTNGGEIDFQSRKLENLVYEGPTDPTTTGSFGNIFSYKNFKLNVFITYSFGNVVRLASAFKEEYSDLDAMPKEFKNRWVQAGDEAITNIPVILTDRQVTVDRELKTLYNAYNYSTARIAKGDFIRMKEISLSYQFPKPWLTPLKISDLSLKLQATNLFLIYADKKLNGQDPEFFRSGGVSAPMPKQLTLTLRVGI
jgi:TonB-linked SusC/RagA family outer membrane protein